MTKKTSTPFDICSFGEKDVVPCRGANVGPFADTNAKQLAIVANRNISAGEKIYVEHSLLSVLTSKMVVASPQEQLKVAVNTLTSPSFSKKAALFWSLLPARSSPQPKQLDSPQRKGALIFKRHAITCGVGDEERQGVYYLSGLMRHSCVPNVQVRDESHDVVVCYATHDIARGTELTRARIALNSCFHKRQHTFVNRFMVSCHCWHCTECEAVPQFMSTDDKFRESIREMSGQLERAHTPWTRAVIITAQNLVTVLELAYGDPNLHNYCDLPLLNATHMRLCQFLLHQKDMAAAFKHLRLVVLYSALITGWSSKHTVRYRDMLEKLVEKQSEGRTQGTARKNSSDLKLELESLPIFDTPNMSSPEASPSKRGGRIAKKPSPIKITAGDISGGPSPRPLSPALSRVSTPGGTLDSPREGSRNSRYVDGREYKSKVRAEKVHTLPSLSSLEIQSPLMVDPVLGHAGTLQEPAPTSMTQQRWSAQLPMAKFPQALNESEEFPRLDPPTTWPIVSPHQQEPRKQLRASEAPVSVSRASLPQSPTATLDEAAMAVVTSPSKGTGSVDASPREVAEAEAETGAGIGDDVIIQAISSPQVAPPSVLSPQASLSGAPKDQMSSSPTRKVAVRLTAFPMVMPAHCGDSIAGSREFAAANRVVQFHRFYGMPGARDSVGISSGCSATSVGTKSRTVKLNQSSPPQQQHPHPQFIPGPKATPPQESRDPFPSKDSAAAIYAYLQMYSGEPSMELTDEDYNESRVPDIPISISEMWTKGTGPPGSPYITVAGEDGGAAAVAVTKERFSDSSGSASGSASGQLVIKLNTGAETNYISYSKDVDSVGPNAVEEQELKPLTAELPEDVGSAFSQYIQTKSK
jgi:hypothetical protein